MFSQWKCNSLQSHVAFVSTESFPKGHIAVIVFVRNQVEVQQQPVFYDTDWRSCSISGRRPRVGFLEWVLLFTRAGNTIQWSRRSPLSLKLNGVPVVSWVQLIFIPSSPEFPNLTNTGIPEHPLCVVGPLVQQYTVLKHVERHMWKFAKPHWTCEAIMDFVFVFVCCYCWGRSCFSGKRIKPPQISWRINVAGFFWPCFYTLNSEVED